MKMLQKRFNKQTAGTLLLIVLIVIVAIAVNLIGIRMAGDIKAWNRWLSNHASAFFVWRLFLYMATACGWWWMHKRVLQHESTGAVKTGLYRAEIGAVASIVLLEATTWLAQG